MVAAVTDQKRAEHLVQVQAPDRAEREQRAGWRARGLTRPVKHHKK